DDQQIELAGEVEQLPHIRALAVQVHRHERAHLRAAAAVDQLAAAALALPLQELAYRRRIDIETARLDVAEHRPGAGARDGARGGEERMRRGDDLIPAAQPEAHQSQQQRIGAGGNTDRMRTVAIRGGRLFEFQHVPAKNKLLIYKDILYD